MLRLAVHVSRPAALALLLTTSGCVPAERSDPGHDAGAPRRGHTDLAPVQVSDSPPDLLEAPSGELLEASWRDDFDRAEVGDGYLATGAGFRIDAGRLCVAGARNHPLWLRARLPVNARIRVEAEAESTDGDIKLEAWGDGRAAATQNSYFDATSYLAIFGGWKNHYHVLARLNEHASDRREVVIEPGSDDPRRRPVQPHQRYQLKLERSDGRTLRFWVDDVEISSWIDAAPLRGNGHDHFAFNDWEARVCFDHLVVEPLPS